MIFFKLRDLKKKCLLFHNIKMVFHVLTPEYWRVFRPPTSILGELGLRQKINYSFNVNFQQIIFWKQILARKVNLWQYLEIAQHITGNKKSVLPVSHSRPNVEIKHSSAQETIWHICCIKESRLLFSAWFSKINIYYAYTVHIKRNLKGL
jgi:hypothetical protein